MKLTLRTLSKLSMVVVMLAVPACVRADAVSDWNAIAVQSTVTAARPGQTGMLDVAMVQLAIYDAVQSIEKKYEPYYVEIPGASGSPEAAEGIAAMNSRRRSRRSRASRPSRAGATATRSPGPGQR